MVMSLGIADIQIPYEIGIFIASQVAGPCDEGLGTSEPSLFPETYRSGPNPSANQMRQGIVFQVGWDSTPHYLYNRAGTWAILTPSTNNFYKIFEKIKNELKLTPLNKNDSDDLYTRSWVVQTWKGNRLETPLSARPEEYIPSDEVMNAFHQFTDTRCLL